MHERWETLGPETLDSIRDAEGVPHEAAAPRCRSTASWCRCGPEDGRAEASWREAACGTQFPSTTPGASVWTALYLGRMPESGPQGHTEGAARKRSRTYQAAAPRRQDRRYRRRRRRIGPSWRPCRPKPRSSTSGMPANISERHPTIAVASDWFERYREVLRHDPCGVDKVIRALRHLRDSANAGSGRDRTGTRLLPQAPPAHALPRPEGRGRRHRLRRGRGGHARPW